MNHFKTRTAVLLACLGTQAMLQVAHAETTYTVDVLGVYSDHAAQRVSDPEALFVSHIEYANKALQNSGANYRYNLVHVQQQNWPSDNGLGSTQLRSLAQDATIKQLRDEYGADLVAGMVPSSSGLCGIGYLPSANTSTQTFYSWANRYGYSLSGHNCGGRTMAHEIGHTMGLGHSPAQGSKGTLAVWGRGWGVNRSFVTIMAYNSAYAVYSSAGRLQIHSNPALSVCRGQACGKSISAQDGADATRALNLAAPQVADWRDSVAVELENRPPVAVNDSAVTDALKPVTINVLHNDSDPEDDEITIDSVADPAHGKLRTVGSQIEYTPDGGFDGEDNFEYIVRDSNGGTDSAVVSVQVKPVDGDGGGEDTGLVLNGGAESGLQGWLGAWGATLALSNDAHSGDSSVRAYGGAGVFAELNTPIDGNSNLAASGWLKASASNRAYVYLRLRQNGRWAYRYMTALSLNAGRWTEFDVTRFISGSKIDDGAILFYFPYGIKDPVLIDDVSLEKM